MTPYGAAAASGFIFAAAHFSSSGFLSLWAIGFTLALTYESSGRLRSSMIAHALWNMGTAAGILVLYG
jgi:membrane protease YdiL (CAAX protease family)